MNVDTRGGGKTVCGQSLSGLGCSFLLGSSSCEVHGNEVADREAKIATQSTNIVFNKLLPNDLKGLIRSHVLGKW